MRHVRAIVAVLFAMSSVSAMATNDLPNVSDEQMACAGAASQEYETANAAIAERATADGILSVDDAIAQRRWQRTFASDGPLASLATSPNRAYGRMPCEQRLPGVSAAKRKIRSEGSTFHR